MTRFRNYSHRDNTSTTPLLSARRGISGGAAYQPVTATGFNAKPFLHLFRSQRMVTHGHICPAQPFAKSFQ